MTLTKKEYKQLEAIKVLYSYAKYVARNPNNDLFIYRSKPFKEEDGYYASNLGFLEIPESKLPSLTWESEPLNIDEVLRKSGIYHYETIVDYKKVKLIKSFYPWGNYIVRLEDGTLQLFDKRPFRDNYNNWVVTIDNGFPQHKALDSETFPYITTRDNEPFDICEYLRDKEI